VEELPVGMQLIGKAYDEETLIRVAHAYEAATSWHTRAPLLTPAQGSSAPSE